MDDLFYFIYFTVYTIASYTTEFGFDYSTGIEYAWGFLICSIVSTIIDAIIFKIAYSCTGFSSSLLDYTASESRKFHWKIRAIFATIIFLIALHPLSRTIMTRLVHITFIFVPKYYQNILNQITDALLSPVNMI